MDGLGLSQAIENLRASLESARHEGRDKPLRFAMESIELELQLALTSEANGKLGFKVLSFEAGVGAKASEVSTQKLKLKMNLVEAADLVDGTKTKTGKSAVNNLEPPED